MVTRLQGRALVLLGMLLTALTLRSAATAVSPLTDELRTDLGIGTVGLSILGLLPPACFAAFGAVGPALARRFGLERALVLGLVVTAFGAFSRAVAPGTTTFLLLSGVALAGMGVGNVLLPPLVKRYFPDLLGPATAGYVVLLSAGAALPSYTGVPLADLLGWRWAIGVWGLLSVLAVLPWLPHLTRTAVRATNRVAGAVRERVPVFRSRRAWGLTVVFGVTSGNVYSGFAWLPEILVDAGQSVGAAGSLLALYAGVAIPTSVVMPLLTVRLRNPYPLLVLFVALFLTGYAGLAFASGTSTWLWVVAAGLGPSSFPMSLTMINLRTTTEAGSSALSGMVQGVGYAGSAVLPLAVGLLHQATGDWTVSLGLLAASTLLILAGGWYACRPGTVEGELGLLPAPAPVRA